MDKQTLKEREEQIVDMVIDYCRQYLDGDYEQLCVKLVRKLGRKRTAPLATGRLEIWAAAAVYTIGSINFLFDKSFQPYVSSADINAHFGTSQSTVAQKSRAIKDMLKISPYWDKEFSTKHMMENNPFNMGMFL